MDHRTDEPEKSSSSRSDMEMNTPPSEPEKMHNHDFDIEAAVEAEPLSESNVAEKEATATETADLERRESTAEDYPHGLKLVLILLSIYCAVFLVALDRTIIATALPRITDEFHSFDDIGWYNGAFTITQSAFMLFFGRIYTFYSPKRVYLALIVIFEIGSALCGAAPNSVAFIWGRAVAGIGASGLFTGSMTLMLFAVPLEKRPLFLGLIGAVFGIASVAGPLLGGVFTSKISWRWCFYINLPIGAVTLALLSFTIQHTEAPIPGLSFRRQLARLDVPGTAIFVPGLTCLLLALQWGGGTYAWSSGRIIALFIVFGVCMIAFGAIQVWKQESGTVPPRILKQRSIAAGAWFTFFMGAPFMAVVYYLPVWFQAIKGDSAIRSGLSTLPLLLALVLGTIISGALVSKIGVYTPFMIASAIIVPIGAGTLCLLQVTTNHSMWIGFQVLFGFGVGIGFQQPNVAAQTVLPRADVPTGVAIVFFSLGMGATVSVAMAQSVLDNKLISGLSGIKGFNPHDIVNIGATQLRGALPAQFLPKVLQVYNDALRDVFYICVAFACMAIFGALRMEWRSVKKTKGEQAKSRQEKITQQEQQQGEAHEESLTEVEKHENTTGTQ